MDRFRFKKRGDKNLIQLESLEKDLESLDLFIKAMVDHYEIFSYEDYCNLCKIYWIGVTTIRGIRSEIDGEADKPSVVKRRRLAVKKNQPLPDQELLNEIFG